MLSDSSFPTHHPEPVCLAVDHVPSRALSWTMWAGTSSNGPATRHDDGAYQRVEATPDGPVTIVVQPDRDQLILSVWGNADASATIIEWAVDALHRWVGVKDDLAGFTDVIASNPTLQAAWQHLGTPILGALPQPVESFSRAVVGQLVQGAEASRSLRQLTRRFGTPSVPLPHGIPTGLFAGQPAIPTSDDVVFAFPSSTVLASTRADQFRHCGVSLRGARALQRFHQIERRVVAMTRKDQFAQVDPVLQSIPGVGVWTAAETRLFLGDADAVSFGDYHLPALVGWTLGDREETDDAMAELLAPYTPHRGRVLQLLERAAKYGIVHGKPRRGPRQPRSTHRYW